MRVVNIVNKYSKNDSVKAWESQRLIILPWP